MSGARVLGLPGAGGCGSTAGRGAGAAPLSPVTSLSMPSVAQAEAVAAGSHVGSLEVWMDELWFASPKLRDDTLDVDVFCKHAESRVGRNVCSPGRTAAQQVER